MAAAKTDLLPVMTNKNLISLCLKYANEMHSGIMLDFSAAMPQSRCYSIANPNSLLCLALSHSLLITCIKYCRHCHDRETAV